MPSSHYLRRILALFCIAGILLAAFIPTDAWMFVAVLGAVCAIVIPLVPSAHRADAEPVRPSLPPTLAAIADRAPPAEIL